MVAALLALACAAAFAGQASAATSRPLLKNIDLADYKTPMGVATDAAGNIYVNVRIHNADYYGMIEKFDAEGNPLNFTGSASYISGNKLLGRPSFGNEGEPTPPGYVPLAYDGYSKNGIAVDSSGGPSNGYIYTSPTFNDGGALYAYKPNGEFAGLVGTSGFSCQVVGQPGHRRGLRRHGPDECKTLPA